VLLVGATGTGKTASAEKSFEHDVVKKFNFSAETTIDQLIGHPSIDSSTNSIIFQSGPYLDAYENGYSLILDEFNLAHEDVLQCIEASLDSNFITIDDPVSGVKQIPMHKNFKLVATQNEAEFEFARKRNKLTTKLTSKFIVIKFEIFSEDELITIAQQMKKQIEIDDETIQKIVSFHMDWNLKPGNSFTIRNMKGVIQSISDKVSPYQAILFNYGSSCDRLQLEELIETMEANGIMFDGKEVVYEFPQWLKDLIIGALKSAGKAAAIALCRRFIADSDGCDLGVSAIMAALGL
jgi:MoxR-like ATPase